MQLPLFLTLLSGISCYKFIVFNPLFAHSHTNFLGKIADTLTEAGHDVTCFMPILDPTLANKTGVKLTKKLVFLQPTERMVEQMEETRNSTMKNLWTTEPGPLSMFKIFQKAAAKVRVVCEDIFKDEATLAMLKKEKFDVAIIEPFTICGYGYAEEIGVPTTIGALSVVHKEHISMFLGEPIAPSYVPTITVPFSDKMTFLQRLKNAVAVLILRTAAGLIYSGEEEYLRERQGDKFPGAAELVARSPVLFTNSNPYLNYPKPKIHKTVDIGGIVVEPEQQYSLDQKWNLVLDERPHTVYISFGTMAKSVDMPQHFKDSILQVCESLPNVTFIWKYEEPYDMADHLPNLYLEPWLPQNGLLADKRLSLFITHGGLGSTTEVAYFGRPSIMIPIFSEQPRNAKMLARHGGSLLLEKAVLGEPEALKAAVLEVLTNQNYTTAASRLADILRSAPISPKELVVRHAEFAARYGKIPQLDPYGRHLSLIEYYNLDVLAVLLLTIISILLGLLFTLKLVLRRLFCPLQKSKSD